LSSLNISSISTSIAFHKGATDENGNLHEAVGSYTRIDGSTGLATDVMFRADFEDSVQKTLLPVPEAIAALPNIVGRGALNSLHQTMVRDSSGEIARLLTDFTGSEDAAARRAIVDQLLVRWTDSQ